MSLGLFINHGSREYGWCETREPQSSLSEQGGGQREIYGGGVIGEGVMTREANMEEMTRNPADRKDKTLE